MNVSDKKETAEMGERVANEEPGPLPPISPDGGIAPDPLVSSPPKIPEATPENFVCLRGPCRHYMELKSIAEVEARSLGYQPVQVNRFCGALDGVHIDITDDCVFECSRWDPEDEDEAVAREIRREKFFKDYPSCAEADATRKREREEFMKSLE